MRKIAVLAMVFVVALSAVAFAGTLTDKEQNLIGTNQARLERTYYPRDMRPYQVSLKFGPPLYTGAECSYNINEMFAIGVGLGTTYPGLTGLLDVTAYLMPTTVAPYVTGGIVYYGNFTDNLIAAEVGGGVDVALDNAFGINLGVDWARSFSNAGAPYKTVVYNGSVNWFNISAGLNYRF